MASDWILADFLRSASMPGAGTPHMSPTGLCPPNYSFTNLSVSVNEDPFSCFLQIPLNHPGFLSFSNSLYSLMNLNSLPLYHSLPPNSSATLGLCSYYVFTYIIKMTFRWFSLLYFFPPKYFLSRTGRERELV